MKKFYLLIVAMVCYAVTVTAQDCPSPNPVAINYPNNGNTPPYCKVVFTGGFFPAQLSIKVGSALIPQWGTGGTTGNTADYYVQVLPDGSATFVYDCALYGNALWAQIEQVVGNVPVKTCQVPVVSLASLPIKLTSFNGRLQTDNSVTLDWSSSIEWNSYEYEVQRSVDGKSFEKVADLKAAGSSNSEVKYKITDLLPTSGAYFYRLKQIDIDGRFEYSKFVYVNSKKGAGIVTKVFPNPFTSEVQLIGATSADMAPGNIKVFNITGQMIKFRIVGANAIAIDDSSPKGLYIIKVKEQQFKLLKQ